MIGWKDAVWLSLDIETTGADPDTAEPVEIGLVWMQGCVTLKVRRYLVKPPIPIPEEASAIHGIRDEDVVNQPTMAELAPDIIEAINEAAVVVGYNGYGYDLPILSRLIPGFREACKGRALIDPLTVVRLDGVGRYWKGPGRHKLTAVAERIEMPGLDGEKAHGAVYDAETAAKVLWYFRDQLPDDGVEAQRYLVREHRQQDENFKAWKARQPPMES